MDSNVLIAILVSVHTVILALLGLCYRNWRLYLLSQREDPPPQQRRFHRPADVQAVDERIEFVPRRVRLKPQDRVRYYTSYEYEPRLQLENAPPGRHVSRRPSGNADRNAQLSHTTSTVQNEWDRQNEGRGNAGSSHGNQGNHSIKRSRPPSPPAQVAQEDADRIKQIVADAQARASVQPQPSPTAAAASGWRPVDGFANKEGVNESAPAVTTAPEDEPTW